jgi:hypothetical protein
MFGTVRCAVALGFIALAACTGPQPSAKFPGALDSGSCSCAVSGESCDGFRGCCASLSCQSGTCQPASAPACAAVGQTCSADVPCCGPASGSVAGCRALDAGVSVCVVGTQLGDPCGEGLGGCTNGLSCDAGTCAFPTTGQTCPRTTGNCQVGDDCLAALEATLKTNNPQDPCFSSGLVCVASPTSYACQAPSVEPPPYFPEAELSADYSICNTNFDNCQPYPGDQATPICGTFFLPGAGNQAASVPVCVEQCTTGDDCGSLAWDCVHGQCVLNYCYAHPDSSGDNVAAEITQAQGTTVTNDPTVLYQPCGNGGPNTYCLPQNDNNWNSTTGICYRLGTPDAGVAGSACDPSGARSDPAGLCAPGNFCLKGTCFPWCDTGKLFNCADSTLTCVSVGGALVTSTANPFGVGVCTDNCDPYVDSTQNSCAPAACGQPTRVCKPTGIDNDVFPSPGICVGGAAEAIPVGLPCDPFQWQDPCVSGAICAPETSGPPYVCAQVCDPSPSPGVTPAPCPGSGACQGMTPPLCANYTNGANGYACHHMGVCL